MPHDLLAERAILGCLIINQSAYDEMADLNLLPEDFYNPQFANIFSSIKELLTENLAIDYVTICSRLAENKKLEQVGGESAILLLAEDQASSANIMTYAKTVKELSTLRQLAKDALTTYQNVINLKHNYNTLIQEAESKFLQISQKSKQRKFKTLKECLKENLRELSKPALKMGEIMGLPTGFTALDKYLLGLRPGQLMIIASRPGMGKTSLALNIAINAIKKSELGVAFFSLEMTADELSTKILSNYAKINSRKILSKDFQDNDLRNIASGIVDLSKFPLFIDDNSDINVSSISSACRKLIVENPLGLVVVDYLQLMQPLDRKIQRDQQVAEMSRAFKILAKELNIPIIVISQLNRQSENRTGNRPRLGDLRESGAIEQDADIVLLIYREEGEGKTAEITIAKNRSGATGKINLAWLPQFASFENLSHAPVDKNFVPNDPRFKNDF